MMAVARLLSHINRIILRHEMWHSVQELKFSVGILSVARTMFFVLFFFSFGVELFPIVSRAVSAIVREK
jgi:hypothetical protein